MLCVPTRIEVIGVSFQAWSLSLILSGGPTKDISSANSSGTATAASVLLPSKKSGIRPQLVHWPSKKLEMDFILESTKNSIHVVNAISPAWTSSMALAELIVERMQS